MSRSYSDNERELDKFWLCGPMQGPAKISVERSELSGNNSVYSSLISAFILPMRQNNSDLAKPMSEFHFGDLGGNKCLGFLKVKYVGTVLPLL